MMRGHRVKYLKIFQKIKIADILTLFNGACGFLAMLSLRERWGDGLPEKEHFYLPAICLIILGMIFDGLDGKVARWEMKRFNNKNKIGHYLDSISDTVTFCLAPAYLLYSIYREPWFGASITGIAFNVVVIVSSLLIAVFGMLRLAKFVSSGHEKDYFEGLPTPPAALLICLLCFLFMDQWYITLPFALLIAFLMISEIEYPKLHGKRTIVFGTLILLFTISLVLMMFNKGNTLTELEIFEYNITAIVAMGAVIFYVFGTPLLAWYRGRRVNYFE